MTREGSRLTLDFPRRDPQPCADTEGVGEALGGTPESVWQADDYLVLFSSEEEVAALRPDFRRLSALGLRGVIATAPSERWDFVCRFFAPKYGIDEDPVTGSAFTQLAPFWAARLGKEALVARQLSSRGGTVCCAVKAERVRISGHAVKYLEGVITCPD